MTPRRPRPFRSLVLPALAAILLSADGPRVRAQEPPPQPSAPIRIEVNRVNVGVIVTDGQGKFVEGLRKEDFHVFDDGAEQPITNFAAIEEPAQVVLFVESGPAVYLLEGGHLRAATALLHGLAPSDQVAVAGYADRPRPVLGFTADKEAAASALVQLRFNLGFGELNLGSSLGALLAGLAPLPGKKTIVLLSTGVDTSPPRAWDALLASLKTGDVRVLGVSLGGELRTPAPKEKQKAIPEIESAAAEGFAEADARLTAIAEATGGRVFFPKDAKEFAAVYSQIAQLVRHEYSLSFAPPARDGRLHSIEVRVGSEPLTHATPPAPAPAYRVYHRRAYVAPQ